MHSACIYGNIFGDQICTAPSADGCFSILNEISSPEQSDEEVQDTISTSAGAKLVMTCSSPPAPSRVLPDGIETARKERECLRANRAVGRSLPRQFVSDPLPGGQLQKSILKSRSRVVAKVITNSATIEKYEIVNEKGSYRRRRG